MTRRAGLTPAIVLATALALIDERGPDGLTLTAVAERTQVAAPSLYKHIRGLQCLQGLVTAAVCDELAAELRLAVLGRSTDDAVGCLLRAHRAYVRRYPQRYAALSRATGSTAGRSADPLTEVFSAALLGYRLEADELAHAARCLHSAAHGFAALEIEGGFGAPVDPDTSFDHLIALCTAGLRIRFGRCPG